MHTPHTYTHRYALTSTHWHTLTDVCTCTHQLTYPPTHLHAHARTHTHARASTHARTHARTRTHTHTHTHTTYVDTYGVRWGQTWWISEDATSDVLHKLTAIRGDAKRQRRDSTIHAAAGRSRSCLIKGRGTRTLIFLPLPVQMPVYTNVGLTTHGTLFTQKRFRKFRQ